MIEPDINQELYVCCRTGSLETSVGVNYGSYALFAAVQAA